MKLSEIKGERVFDVVADIIEPIVNIAQDDEAAELFAPKEKPEDVKPWDFFLMRIKKSLPSLVRNHRKDFVTILAAMNDVTPEEYVKDMSLATLLNDVVGLLTDEEFVSFFD